MSEKNYEYFLGIKINSLNNGNISEFLIKEYVMIYVKVLIAIHYYLVNMIEEIGG